MRGTIKQQRTFTPKITARNEGICKGRQKLSILAVLVLNYKAFDCKRQETVYQHTKHRKIATIPVHKRDRNDLQGQVYSSWQIRTRVVNFKRVWCRPISIFLRARWQICRTADCDVCLCSRPTYDQTEKKDVSIYSQYSSLYIDLKYVIIKEGVNSVRNTWKTNEEHTIVCDVFSGAVAIVPRAIGHW